jgi:uncharacterized protein (TIGR03790 family)
MTRLLLALLTVCAAVALLSCGNVSAPPTHPGGAEAGRDAGLAQSLPALESLPYPHAPLRRASDAAYELLDNPPVLQATGGVTYMPGQVSLDPAAAGGLAWAVFALNGFPVDHATYPTAVEIVPSAPCWIGYSDYSRARWGFIEALGPNSSPYTDGTQLISPAGVHYVAVIAQAGQVTVMSLRVNTNASLPEAPVAVLNVLSQVVVGLPATFSATGSTPGTGTFQSITYDWGDGTGPDVVADPTQEVQHTYSATGIKTVLLTVLTDQSLSDTDQKDIDVGTPMRDLLLVYNADIPEDLDLANYYASPRTGRAVDPAYILGIHPMAAANPEEIARSDYNSSIRDPIKAFIDASTFKNTLKYIVLCKGIPHKIQGTSSDASSVDSELCLLYSDDTYSYDGWVWNGQTWDTLDASGFYLKDDTAFTPHTFNVCTQTETFKLDYLVGRLSAYSYDNVKQMIDRALVADTSGTGSIIFDSSNADFGGYPQNYYDTMVDPVYPSTNDNDLSGYELLSDAGFATFQDVSTLVLTGLTSDNITVPIDKVIGYCGWGTNHAGGGYPNGGNYILKDLLFTYLPGACWMSYESFNGRTFVTGDIGDPIHGGQGVIADFLYKGGTVAIGNAWEPYTIGVGDERWVFDRYIHHGDRWIEAAYKGLRLLSWQEVVVGDPLCQVK